MGIKEIVGADWISWTGADCPKEIGWLTGTDCPKEFGLLGTDCPKEMGWLTGADGPKEISWLTGADCPKEGRPTGLKDIGAILCGCELAY